MLDRLHHLPRRSCVTFVTRDALIPAAAAPSTVRGKWPRTWLEQPIWKVSLERVHSYLSICASKLVFGFIVSNFAT